MLLRKTKLDYLKGNLESCSQNLNSLQKIVNDSSGDNFTDKFSDQLNPNNHNWKALKQQISCLVKNLSLGLDYYGNQPNYVPIATYYTYRDLIDNSLLKIVGDIERAYKNYKDAGDVSEEKQDTLRTSLEQAKILADKMLGSIKITDDEIVALSKFIDEKQSELIRYKTLLEQAERNFQEDVKAQSKKNNNDCDYMATIQAATAIAGIFYPPAGAVATAISVFNSGANADNQMSGAMKSAAGLIGVNTARVITRAIVVGQAVGSVAEAYQKIKAMHKDDDDQAKVLVDLKDYKEELKPYLALESARKYKQLIDSYLNTIETRNKAVVDLNGKLSEPNKTTGRA